MPAANAFDEPNPTDTNSPPHITDLTNPVAVIERVPRNTCARYLQITESLINALDLPDVFILSDRLKNPLVKECLQNIPRNHHLFVVVCDRLARSKNLRAATEILDAAIKANPDNLPEFLCTKPVNIHKVVPTRKSLFKGKQDFDKKKTKLQQQSSDILFAFFGVKKALATGHKWTENCAENNASIPPLCEAVIHKIFDMAIGPEDLIAQPVAKARILNTAYFCSSSQKPKA
jgi:hypothetical protein